jgi:hypothetical protein
VIGERICETSLHAGIALRESRQGKSILRGHVRCALLTLPARARALNHRVGLVAMAHGHFQELRGEGFEAFRVAEPPERSVAADLATRIDAGSRDALHAHDGAEAFHRDPSLSRIYGLL